MVLVTQPRRLAAMALADRVASERSSPLPGKPKSEVGYVVRLDRAMNPHSTKLVYCTVGILVRMLVNDPKESDRDGLSLSRCAVLVIDEVHERDLNTDFCLTLLKILLLRQQGLKIVLMSATAAPQLFVDYFGRDMETAPLVISIPGRTFPVTNYFLPECESLARTRLDGWTSGSVGVDRGSKTCHEVETAKEDDDARCVLSPRAQSQIDNVFICKLISAILKETVLKPMSKLSEHDKSVNTCGSLLVFLPGKREIESLACTLHKDPVTGNKAKCKIFTLHSKTHPAEQRAAFLPVADGTITKVVLATNVAETSITIPDISAVIDTGRVKESRFNSSTRIKELTTVWTSQASATQRAGRAGRTGPGVCYKLYTSDFCQRHMPHRTSPEIVRTPLDELVLQVCLLEESHRDSKQTLPGQGTSPVQFLEQAPEPPSPQQVHFACKHLLEAGALTVISKDDGKYPLFRLTPLGYHLSHLPMDAKVGKVLIVGCVLGCLEPSLTVAAALCSTKTCWLDKSRHQNPPSRSGNESTKDLQREIVRKGFGGESWRGGTVKGDIIGMIAAYNTWSSFSSGAKRRQFARDNALDHGCLCDMFTLRNQFQQSLEYAGFLSEKVTRHDSDIRPTGAIRVSSSSCDDDALLTSCCLVAGLYPNIATLLRPNKAQRIRGGRLITKDGNACRPSSSSFQAERISNASEGGKDAYVVFHSKHRTVGTSSSKVFAEANRSRKQQEECFLSEINFVSRYAILLFGGDFEIRENNAIIVDGWLKFKIGEKGQKHPAVLLQELRKELDSAILKRIGAASRDQGDADRLQSECKDVVQVVRELLAQE